MNNAGVTHDQLLTRLHAEDFMSVIQTNLLGTFNMTKYALKVMQRQRQGAIVNVASVVGLHAISARRTMRLVRLELLV